MIISTDEDPGFRIESFALKNLSGVSTNKKVLYVLSPCKPTNNLIFNFSLPNIPRNQLGYQFVYILH
jgi:hypothetical protein